MASKRNTRSDSMSVTSIPSQSKTLNSIVNQEITETVKYKLGNWIAKIFKIDVKIANKISKIGITIVGSLISLTTAILAILELCGVQL